MYAIHGSRQSQNYEQVQMLDAYLAYSIQVQKNWPCGSMLHATIVYYIH